MKWSKKQGKKDEYEQQDKIKTGIDEQKRSTEKIDSLNNDHHSIIIKETKWLKKCFTDQVTTYIKESTIEILRESNYRREKDKVRKWIVRQGLKPIWFIDINYAPLLVAIDIIMYKVC